MKTTEAPTKVLTRLRAIRDDLNEQLAGKSFAEQQDYIRRELRRASRGTSRAAPARRRRTA